MGESTQEKILIKGTEAMAEGAVIAGCRHYFGYPITPQSELPAYLSWRFREVDGVFLQAESELAAINMVMGAAATGKRAMTSSSSPGMSLKQEGISYIIGCELPCVVANIMRGGPGLGNIMPSHGDYFQSVKGGGHGDYNWIVLAPTTCQEMMDLTIEAFDLADKYRNPVLLLGDGALGQMMEPVVIRKNHTPAKYDKSWALTGAKGRPANVINSLYLDDDDLEQHNLKLQKKFAEMKKNEVRFKTHMTDDADIVIVAYGTASRICYGVVEDARRAGKKVGLMTPISLWPYPSDAIAEMASRVRGFLVVEMNAGQMVEDVRLAVNGKCPVEFYGRMGGGIPRTTDIHEALSKI